MEIIDLFASSFVGENTKKKKILLNDIFLQPTQDVQPICVSIFSSNHI